MSNIRSFSWSQTSNSLLYANSVSLLVHFHKTFYKIQRKCTVVTGLCIVCYRMQDCLWSKFVAESSMSYMCISWEYCIFKQLLNWRSWVTVQQPFTELKASQCSEFRDSLKVDSEMEIMWETIATYSWMKRVWLYFHISDWSLVAAEGWWQ
jgi:hypothetical protein